MKLNLLTISDFVLNALTDKEKKNTYGSTGLNAPPPPGEPEIIPLTGNSQDDPDLPGLPPPNGIITDPPL